MATVELQVMKKAVRTVGIVAGLGAVAWLMKDRLLRVPDAGEAPISGFRVPDTNGHRKPTAVEPPSQSDDLTKIVGIGPVYSRRLGEMNITSFKQLAAVNAVELADKLDISAEQAADWIGQASDLA